jgi:predicted RNase H-like nuclease
MRESANPSSIQTSTACHGIGANLPPQVAIVVGEGMILVVGGFDSAWTPGNSGATAGLLLTGGGGFREIGPPQVVSYSEAEQLILDWQWQFGPNRTLVLLDQPTIVVNPTGQRPVEGLVSPSVSLRLGGMQPASHSRIEILGAAAPVWNFLRRFGGAADPLRLTDGTQVIETYPVLVLIALRWLQNGRGVSGILPKYNPHHAMNARWARQCHRSVSSGVKVLPR